MKINKMKNLMVLSSALFVGAFTLTYAIYHSPVASAQSQSSDIPTPAPESLTPPLPPSSVNADGKVWWKHLGGSIPGGLYRVENGYLECPESLPLTDGVLNLRGCLYVKEVH